MTLGLVAHLSSGHWWFSMLYMLPVFTVLGMILFLRWQERRERRTEVQAQSDRRRPKR